jgi:uncharacterized protein
MSKDSLPTQVNPIRFAENASILRGTLQLKNMPLLCSSLLMDEGEVQVELTFDVDRQRIRYIQGHVETEVVLQCQRCLESFKYGIISDFMSGLVNSEEAAKALPERYDPLIVSDNQLIIKDMIEEELILSLPIVPMHDPKDCKKSLPLFVADDDTATSFTKESPFKVIESLKQKKE